jgi:inorganic pyrophosphatase
MSDRFIQIAPQLTVERYKQPRDIMTIAKSHVSFSGALQKHPVDPDKVILILDPLSMDITYFEFNRGDIAYIEKLPGITSLEGETANITRVWVKKNSIAVRCTPFVVNKPESIP